MSNRTRTASGDKKSRRACFPFKSLRARSSGDSTVNLEHLIVRLVAWGSRLAGERRARGKLPCLPSSLSLKLALVGCVPCAPPLEVAPASVLQKLDPDGGEI